MSNDTLLDNVVPTHPQLWVIAYTPSGFFIGVPKSSRVGPEQQVVKNRQDLLTAISKQSLVYLQPAYIFFDTYQQQMTPQGLAVSHTVMALPIGHSFTETSGVWTRITNFKIIEDEAEFDRKEYMKMIQKAQDTAGSQRAERSGISLAPNLTNINRKR